MRATLIVNADDYGFTPGVSAGIRAAHHRGIVTSTTVLIVAPSARADLGEAKASCPDLGIGVHLTLTGGWRPILDSARLPTITTRRGKFHSRTQLAALVARARPSEVLDEWRAQIEAVLDAGVDPDHLDAHHHVAYRRPALTEVLMELATHYKLPVRLPVPPSTDTPTNGLIAAGELRDLASAFGIVHPDELLTGFYSRGASLAGLLAPLVRLRPGRVAELMCHPGMVDWKLRIKSSYTRARERELAVLTDESVRRALSEHDLRLATFATLGTSAKERDPRSETGP